MSTGERPLFDVKFICTFCGRQEIEKVPVDLKIHKSPGCSDCMVSVTARRGTRIRFDAAARCPDGAIYADHHLIRGAVYTVKRVHQWQHGAWVTTVELPDQKFDIMIFVPHRFKGKAQDGRPNSNTTQQ